MRDVVASAMLGRVGDERIERLRRAAAQGDTDAEARHACERWRRAGERPTTATWARVVRRAGSAAWTPAALSDARLRALTQDLARLEHVDAGLAARAVAFVRAGVDDGLLAHLASRAQAAAAQLSLKTGLGFAGAARAVFAVGDAPPAFLLRLGVLYDACQARAAWRQLPAELGWFELLLWEASAARPFVSGHLDHPTRLSAPEFEAALRLARLSPRWLVRVAVTNVVERPHDTLAAVLASMGGFGAALGRSRRAVLRGLTAHDAEGRARVFDLLARSGADPGPWTAELVRAATQDGAAAVRRAATPLVRALGERAREPLRALAAARRSKKLRALVAALLEELPAARPDAAPRGDARAALRVAVPGMNDAALDAFLEAPSDPARLVALGRPFARAGGAAGDLVAAAEALALAGVDPDALGAVALDARTTFRAFSAERWTGAPAYYAARPHLLLAALRELPAAVGSWRTSLLAELAAVLDQLEPLPEPLVEPLLALALGASKKDRAMARARLARLPGLRKRVAREAASSRATVRAQATAWLAELPVRAPRRTRPGSR